MTVERRLKTSQDSVVSQIQKFGSKIFSVLGVSGSRCFESKEPKNVFKFFFESKTKKTVQKCKLSGWVVRGGQRGVSFGGDDSHPASTAVRARASVRGIA